MNDGGGAQGSGAIIISTFFRRSTAAHTAAVEKKAKRAFVVKWMGHMSGKARERERERIFKRQRSKSRCEFYDCVGGGDCGGDGLSGALHLSVHYIWSSINKSERRELRGSATVATRSAALHSTAEPQLKL